MNATISPDPKEGHAPLDAHDDELALVVSGSDYDDDDVFEDDEDFDDEFLDDDDDEDFLDDDDDDDEVFEFDDEDDD
ncbi:MAG: hypothetical protein ACF8GE_10955 [Phycisphaerales bacterium JB043]